MEAKVIRCGCGDPLRIHARNSEGALSPCPTPRQEIDLGTVAYYHADQEKQAAWDAKGQLEADQRIADANAGVSS